MPALFPTSALTLLAVNLGVVGFAVIGAWSLSTILATYLLQSVIIGIFQAKKMSDLQRFSTTGLKMGGRSVEPTPATRRKVVAFFLLHYGLFHAAYAGFIAAGTSRLDWLSVALSGAAFFANHLFSYFEHRAAPCTHVPNIGRMMLFPYIRIVPMHVFIVFGALTFEHTAGLVFFLVLKTLADLATHAIEHARSRAPA